MTITVYGTPAPQGSKRSVGNNRFVESSPKVKPWRQDVKFACLESLKSDPVPFTGPVSVEVTFTLARPASTKKTVFYPFRKPDLDKLLRSTFDALTESGLVEDDSRIVAIKASKVFPVPGGGVLSDALRAPGAVIHVRSMA